MVPENIFVCRKTHPSSDSRVSEFIEGLPARLVGRTLLHSVDEQKPNSPGPGSSKSAVQATPYQVLVEDDDPRDALMMKVSHLTT